ncbi:MAG: hypothetical protein AAB091_00820 [Elusimicrobiota bacterium]
MAGIMNFEDWKPRHNGSGSRFYEAWFLKLNDPVTRNALWVRYTLLRGQGKASAACWYVVFDSERGKIFSGRWEEPFERLALSGEAALFALSGSSLGLHQAQGKGPDVGWKISWRGGDVPAFRFVPGVLVNLGIARSNYVAPMSFGLFDGEAVVGDRRYVFCNAPGSAGHLWGSRMADNWRWAQAIFTSQEPAKNAVFEILSAQVRVGSWLAPRMTLANLWHEGRLYRAGGVLRALSNRTEPNAQGWAFHVNFGDITAEGSCVAPESMTARLEYTDTDARRLESLNYKTGAMKLRLLKNSGEPLAQYEQADGAAVETVRGLPWP